MEITVAKYLGGTGLAGIHQARRTAGFLLWERSLRDIDHGLNARLGLEGCTERVQ